MDYLPQDHEKLDIKTVRAARRKSEARQVEQIVYDRAIMRNIKTIALCTTALSTSLTYGVQTNG